MLSKNRAGTNPEINRASHTSSSITFLSVFGLSIIAMPGTAQATRNVPTMQLIHLRCDNTTNDKTDYTMRNKSHKNYIR